MVHLEHIARMVSLLGRSGARVESIRLHPDDVHRFQHEIAMDPQRRVLIETENKMARLLFPDHDKACMWILGAPVFDDAECKAGIVQVCWSEQ
jgi:23S rRNA A2030 N6-methylase RlmJ